MAARHVNVVEHLFVLSNRSAAGDSEALAELASAYQDDARVDTMLGVGPPAEHGPAAVRGYFGAVAGSYAQWQCVLDYVQDYEGGRVLALGALRTLDHGGRAREHPIGWIFTFRRDKVASMTSYPSYGEALRAATARAPLANVKAP